jgi:hypothetical protein
MTTDPKEIFDALQAMLDQKFEKDMAKQFDKKDSPKPDDSKKIK